MLKKAAIGLILTVVVFILTKDIGLKIAIEHYLTAKFNLESSIGELRLSWNNLTISEAKLSKKDISISLAYLKVSFKLKELFAAKKLKIAVRGISAKLNNDNILLEGAFSGNFILELEEKSFSEFQGKLTNINRGLINIKKESSLQRLSGYLDKASYQALLEGFKNYGYNQGVITIAKKQDMLFVGLNFDSEAAGKRKIALNLHDVFQ